MTDAQLLFEHKQYLSTAWLLHGNLFCFIEMFCRGCK